MKVFGVSEDLVPGSSTLMLPIPTWQRWPIGSLSGGTDYSYLSAAKTCERNGQTVIAGDRLQL